MLKSVKLAPIFSIIFLSDNGPIEVPKHSDVRRINASASCIAVPTFPEADGETQITLSNSAGARADVPAFDGLLETPNKFLAVATGDDVQLLGAEVASVHTRVRIWTNHPTEPDMIDIVLD